jgi:hypothetical protein
MSRRGWLAALVGVALAGLTAAATQAEVTTTHDTVITFKTRMFPRVLPRDHAAPVAVSIEGRLRTRKEAEPAPLTELELAIHRAAAVFRRGLPVCPIARIDPANSAKALAVCGRAKIGYGRIEAQSTFPGQPRFSFNGRVVLFNGRLQDGRPAILIHVFNRVPPSSFVFPLVLSHARGMYGTKLTAHLRLGRWSRITFFRLVLDRNFREGGNSRGYLSASCPAPRGFRVGIAPFVRATLSFADQTKAEVAVVSSCRVAP